MKSEDISIVIQGPLRGFKDNQVYIGNIRKIFPKAEIIVSTHVGNSLTGLDGVDKILVSSDPGAMVFDNNCTKTNNINRMLTSAKKGVQAASKRYILKLRSDLIPENTNFIKHWKKLSVRPKKYGIFSRQILAYPIYSLMFEGKKRKMPKPFHVSDWAFFGIAEDIKLLFDVPLVLEPKFSRYFDTNEMSAFDTLPSVKWQYSPEQYLTYMTFSKKYYVKFDNKQDYNRKNIKISNEFIFNNYIFLDPDMWGLRHNKQLYDKRLFEYDNNCYYGLIQFGVFVKKRIKYGFGLLTPFEYIALGIYRKSVNDFFHKKL